jgi:gliding motility-associated-like protein
VCNSTANGSVFDFSAWIIGGDTSGTWINTMNVPVDFSNPDSVDFNGIAEGYYLFQYETNSAMSPCAETMYNLIVSVEDCSCPTLIVQNVPGGICNTLDSLNLDAFVMAGGPGSWQIINGPGGSNPATISGNQLVIEGCDQGTYDIRFTFDAAPLTGCPDSADIQIFIQEELMLTVSGDTSTCGQVPVQLNAIIGGSANGLAWTTSGNGSYSDPDSVTTIYTPSPNDVASAGILLIAASTDTFGFCEVKSDTISLFLVTPPSTTFSALTDTLCNHPDSGSVINLFSFILEGDGTGTWTDIDASMVDLSDPTHVDFANVVAGSYRILYTTQTALAPCTDSMYVFTVVIEDCGCPPLVLSPDDISLCQGESADLNNELINADPGSWSIVSGPAGTWPSIMGSILTTDNAAGGSYILKFELTDSIPDCPASMSHALHIEAPPALNIIDLICDADQIFYEIILETDATGITSDFGKVNSSGPGEFNIDSVPAGQHVVIMATGSLGLCQWIFNVTSPDCNCTLEIEDIADTIRFCPGDTFVLIPVVTGAQGLPFSTWITPTGTKMQPTLPLYEEGDYIWIVRDMAGCEERDSFSVAFIGPEGAIMTTIPPVCPDSDDGQLIIESVLGGTSPFQIQLDTYPPQPVSQFPFLFDQVPPGHHVISISDAIGCTIELPVVLTNGDLGDFTIGPDVVVVKGDSTLISPLVQDIDVMNVIWEPVFPGQGIDPFWITPDVSMLLTATLTDSTGCLYQDQMQITVIEEETFFVPNVFSPNGDAINDIAVVMSNLPNERLLSFEVFDRWGNMMYRQDTNHPFQWDGRTHGKEAQSGVYVYKLIWEDIDGDVFQRIGDITLLR